MKKLILLLTIIILIIPFSSCTEAVYVPDNEIFLDADNKTYPIHRKFVYNSQGQLTEIVSHDNENEAEQYEKFFFVKGVLSVSAVYLSSGTMISRKRYVYSDNGRLELRISENDNGATILEERYNYLQDNYLQDNSLQNNYSDNNATKTTNNMDAILQSIDQFTVDGELIGKRIFYYNDQNRLVKEKVTDALENTIIEKKIVVILAKEIKTEIYSFDGELIRKSIRFLKPLHINSDTTSKIQVAGKDLYVFD